MRIGILALGLLTLTACGELRASRGVDNKASLVGVQSASSSPSPIPNPIIPTVQPVSAVSGCKDTLTDGRSSMREALCELVSKYRASYGLGRVKLSLNLNFAAQLHAQDMYSKNYFDHVSLDGRTVADRIAQFTSAVGARGENIAEGFHSAEEVFDAWIQSPGHRANILQPGFNLMGVGIAGSYWVQDFSS